METIDSIMATLGRYRELFGGNLEVKMVIDDHLTIRPVGCLAVVSSGSGGMEVRIMTNSAKHEFFHETPEDKTPEELKPLYWNDPNYSIPDECRLHRTSEENRREYQELREKENTDEHV